MTNAGALLEPLGGILESYVQRVVEDAVRRMTPPPIELPPPDPRLELLTLKEAAVPMRRSEQTLWKWCRQGRIGRKVGGGRNYFISRHEINEYLRGRLMVHGEGRK